MDVLTNWIIPLLLYSGPLFTFGTVAVAYRNSARTRLFYILLAVHVLAFVPFIYAASNHQQDYLHALLVPAATGFLMFFGGLVYFAYLSVVNRAKST